ncbi:MAG: hypothetical protein V1799_04120 [bacterium]
MNVFSNIISGMNAGVSVNEDAISTIGQNSGNNGGNNINDCNYCVEIYSSASNIQVKHNTLTPRSGCYGILTYGSPSIEYNLIDGGSIAIFALSQAPGTIIKNEIKNFTEGVYLGYSTTPPTSGNQYSYNNFTSNNWNTWNCAKDAGNNPITVSCPNNWWGICPTSDIPIRMYGPVSYVPFSDIPVVRTGPYGAGTGGSGCPPPSDIVAYWSFNGNTSD